jgi:hypothetical protein
MLTIDFQNDTKTLVRIIKLDKLMNIKYFNLLILLFISVQLKAQDSIHFDYPQNIEDCFEILEMSFTEKNKTAFIRFEETNLVSYHHTLGKSIRNNFYLWSFDAEIVKYFNNMKIYSADDMSAIIIMSWHRKLNNKPLEIDEQIKILNDFWKREKCRTKRCKRNMPSFWDCRAIAGNLDWENDN